MRIARYLVMGFGGWGGAILVIATTVPPLRKEWNIRLKIAGIPPLTTRKRGPADHRKSQPRCNLSPIVELIGAFSSL